MPFAYVIGLLPFCTLLCAGTVDALWSLAASARRWSAARAGRATVHRGWRRRLAGRDGLASLPTLKHALERSQVPASFGDVTVHAVMP